jgi:hypothetical protein
MPIVEPTSTELEFRADCLRRQIAQDWGELNGNLKPHSLYQEAVRGAGFDKASISSSVDSAVRRYPVPTAIGAAALGLFAYSVVRKRNGRRSIDNVKASLAQTATTLADSATDVFHRRAEEKKREFVDLAQAQIVCGAGKVSDAIERKIGDTVDILPGGAGIKPLLVSGIQILLSAALGGLMRPAAR